MATPSSSASSVTLPTSMLEDRPVLPLSASLGRPHRGEKRGKSTNSASMRGAPASAIRAAVRADSRSRGWPVGRWALMSAVSRPSRPMSAASAAGSDCESKNAASSRKKPRKKTTSASRRARSSSVLSASSAASRVTPASRPRRLRWLIHAPAKVSASASASVQRPGSGRAASARRARHSSTPAAAALHHSGRLAACGSSTQAMTSSVKRVSRVSRGRRARRSVRAFIG